MTTEIDAFHAHLDGCAQCRDRPMQPCEQGAELLRIAATSIPLRLRPPVPPVPPPRSAWDPYPDDPSGRGYHHPVGRPAVCSYCGIGDPLAGIP